MALCKGMTLPSGKHYDFRFWRLLNLAVTDLESFELKRSLLPQPSNFKEKLPDKNISTFTPAYQPCFQSFKTAILIGSRKISCAQTNQQSMDINTLGINYS